MSVIPDLNRASSEEISTSSYTQGSETQLIGCYMCLFLGNPDAPETIYHYVGTTYCMDHLHEHLTSIGVIGQ